MFFPLVFVAAVLLLVVCLLSPKVKDGVVAFAYCLIVAYLTFTLLHRP